MALGCLSGEWLMPLSHGITKHRQNLLAGYKEQKTTMKLQTQLLGSSLQAEEIKDGRGQWIVIFSPSPPFSSFWDLPVEKHTVIYALGLQLGTCALPYV